MRMRLGLLGAGIALAWATHHVAWSEERAPQAPAQARGVLEGTVRVRGVASKARVELRRREPTQILLAAGPPLAAVTTDDAGRFRFANVAQGTYEVRSVVEGVVPGYSYARSNGRQTLEVPVAIPGGPHTLTGRARWPDGRPFLGTIHLESRDRFHATLVASRGGTFTPTDAQGRFAFVGVGPGHVWVKASEGATFHAQLGRFWVPQQGPLELDVGDGSPVVRGRVIDATTGEPVTQARVKGGDWLEWHEVRTDATGGFQILVPRHERLVSAWAEGYATGRIQTNPGDARVELALARGTKVHGTVRAADGAPVRGARIWYVRSVFDTWAYDIHATTSGADGTYVLEHAEPGAPMIFAWGGGWATKAMDPFHPERSLALRVPLANEAQATHDLSVLPTLAANVRVLDDAGQPVPDAIVAAQPVGAAYTFLGEESFDALGEATTDPSGNATLKGLAPGLEYGLTVAAPGHWAHEPRDARLAPGAAEPVVVRLPERRYLEARVVQHGTGRPIRGASLSLYFRDGGGGWSNDIAARWVTDEQGKARLGPLPKGSLGVKVEHDLYAPAEIQPVAGDEPVTLTLAVGSFLEAEVVGSPALTGRLAQVKITSVDSPSGDYPVLSVPIGGRYHSVALRPGAFDLSAEVHVGADVYEARVRCRAGEPGLVLRLDPAVARVLRLRVLDPEGRPVARASALALRQHGVLQSRQAAVVLQGRAQIDLGQAPGELRVEVWGAQDEAGRSLGLGAATRRLDEVGVEPIDVQLPRERRVRGRVRTDAGAPVPGVRVVAMPADGSRPAPFSVLDGHPHAEVVSGADGTFELGDLGPSPYLLWCGEVEGFATAEPALSRAGPAQPLELVLERGTDITLVVVDGAGAPVPDARVWLWWRTSSGPQVAHQSRYTGWRTGADGKVTLPCVVSGRAYNARIEPPYDRKDLGSLDLDPWTPRSGTVTLRAR
jgi:protocatechuate 3,4-dioxygenase beta subunit